MLPITSFLSFSFSIHFCTVYILINLLNNLFKHQFLLTILYASTLGMIEDMLVFLC